MARRVAVIGGPLAGKSNLLRVAPRLYAGAIQSIPPGNERRRREDAAAADSAARLILVEYSASEEEALRPSADLIRRYDAVLYLETVAAHSPDIYQKQRGDSPHAAVMTDLAIKLVWEAQARRWHAVASMPVFSRKRAAALRILHQELGG